MITQLMRLLRVCLLLLLGACQPDRSATRTDAPSGSKAKSRVLANDFRIVPGQRVGPVRYATSEADLLRLLGASVVTAGDTVYGAEGAMFIGTTLYGGTADQVQILYRDSVKRQHPDLVLIRPYVADVDGEPVRPARWTTGDGLRIGTTLAELERRNGRSFRLWGFEWDYGGTISDWRGGRLDGAGSSLLSLTLGSAPRLTPAQDKALNNVLGDSEFSSANASMRTLNPVVQRMQVSLTP